MNALVGTKKVHSDKKCCGSWIWPRGVSKNMGHMQRSRRMDRPMTHDPDSTCYQKGGEGACIPMVRVARRGGGRRRSRSPGGRGTRPAGSRSGRCRGRGRAER